MNADRLLAHYEKIADAPDAVQRLRRFILDLAVRGKLAEQDPNDEPASELLKRIVVEKAERVKRQKSLPDFEADELGDVPTNWCAVPLIVLGQWAIGSGFPKNEQGRSEGPYFFLKVSDMNLPENDKYITTANNCIDGDAAKRMKAAIHPAGTIIFPKIGGAIATNKRRILTRGSAIDNNCLGITFSSHINIEWAYLLMTHLDFTRYQAGTAVPALQQGTLATIPVALPSLAEQHRIVAKVDELMALCDRLKAARTAREATRDRLAAATLARLNAPDPDPAVFQNHAAFALDNLIPLTTRPDQIKALRQTILNLAVRGKLVPQDPNDQPATELLKRIAVDKARLVKAGVIRRQNPLPSLADAKTSFELPKGWVWTRLGHLSQFVTSGSRDWAKHYSDEGAIFIRMGNLSKDHYHLRLDHIQRVKPPVNGEGTRTRLESCDICISITGDVGMLGLIPERFGESYINQHTAMVRPMPEMKGHYLAEMLRSPFAQEQFNEPQRGIKNSFRLTDVTQLSQSPSRPSPSSTASSPKSMNLWPSATDWRRVLPQATAPAGACLTRCFRNHWHRVRRRSGRISPRSLKNCRMKRPDHPKC